MSFLDNNNTSNEESGTLLQEYASNGKLPIQLGGELKPLVADFVRDGVDLVIKDDAGDFSVVKGYFSTFPSADLITEGGAVLSGSVVSKLSGPGPLAQSSSSQTDESPIGQVDDAGGQILIKHADGTSEEAFEGSFIYKGDVIETGADGNLNITFIDDTKFSMGPGGRAVMDDLVYNTEDNSDNGMGVSLLQGVFSFVSGKIAKDDPESVSIKTPVGTIGIRGTAWSGKVAQLGEESLFTLFSGAIVVANEGGSELLTISQQSVILTSFSIPPSKPFVLAEEQLIDAYGKVLQLINPEWGADEDFDPENINPQAGPQGGNSRGGGGAGFQQAQLEGLGDGLGLGGILSLSDLLSETDLTEDELRRLLDPLRDPTTPDAEVRVISITDPETNTVSAFNVEVFLSTPSLETITIFYEVIPGTATTLDTGAPGDVDYVDQGGGILTLLPGQTSASFSVTLLDDDVIENTEFFVVQLTGAINANIDPLASSAIIVIEDDDVGIISIQPVSDPVPAFAAFAFAALDEPSDESDVTVDEGDGVMQFKFVLDKAVAPGVDVRVDYILEGEGAARTGIEEGVIQSAYFNGGTTGLPAGSEVIVEIALLDSDQFEGDQSFTITIVGGSSNATADTDGANLSVTVEDDESAVVVSDPQDADVSEFYITDVSNDNSLGIESGSGSLASVKFAADQPQFDALSLESNGVPVLLSGAGTSVMTGQANGVTIFTVSLSLDGTYDFELTGPLDHLVDGLPSSEDLSLVFAFEVEDENGSSASNSFAVDVADDAPEAVSENDSVLEGQTATGNILTGIELSGDANDTDGNADVMSADVTVLVYAKSTANDALPNYFSGEDVIQVVGNYGTLTLNVDGTYSYVALDGIDNTEAVVDNFVYRIEDADGDYSLATLSITVNDAHEPQIGAIARVSVDEDDLANGSDSTKESLTSGAEIPISFNGDGPGEVTLDITGFPVVFSKGDPVEYSVETLEDGVTVQVTAIALPEEGAPRTVFTLDFAPNGNGDNYAYTITLEDVLDHPQSGEDPIEFEVGITAEDQDGGVDTGSFKFSVIDDTPIAFDDMEVVVTVPEPNFDLVFVLDTSSSMSNPVPQDGGESKTIMQILKEAVVQLLSEYSAVGTAFSITIIDFDTDSELVFSGTSIAEAIEFINDPSNLVPSGFTNYASALANDENGAQGVLTEHLNNPDLDGYAKTVYFLSDGAPNPVSGQVPLDDDLQNPWQQFVDSNGIEVVAVGIGDAVSTSQLNRVENSGDSATVIDDANDLEAVLNNTLPEIAEGNIVSNGIVDKLGADGATVTSFVFGTDNSDLAAAYDAAGADVTEIIEGQYSVVFDIPENGDPIEIELEFGSIFSIDKDGEYRLEAAAGVPAGTVHQFEYSLLDGDGDIDQAVLSFTFVNEGEEPILVEIGDNTGELITSEGGDQLLEGSAANDTLVGGDGNDTLDGGGGDDVMTGGAGEDTFIVSSDADGNIIITDFDVAEDTIDLDSLFDALSLEPEDRGEGDAWELEVASGVTTLTVVAGNGPNVIFDNMTDPSADDLAALSSRVHVSDES